MDYVLFFYSPYAGDNKILQYLDVIVTKYQEKGISILPYRVTSPRIVEQVLSANTIPLSHILIAGGDGTVNMVVNIMKRLEVNTPIATLPAGTANDFAHTLGYPASIPVACDIILSGDVAKIDLGVVNNRYFVNVLSAGLLTDVSQRTPTILKNTFGKLAYYMSSIQDLPRFRKVKITLESEEMSYSDSALMFFVFNGKTAGNLNFAPNADLKDGMFDVLVIKGRNLVETMNSIFGFLSGIHNNYPKGILYFKVDKMTIESDDALTIDIDGEQGPALPITVECIKGGIEVILPNYDNMPSSYKSSKNFMDIMK